jgi:hypothetical protein
VVYRAKPLSQRFWPKVDILRADDCWHWMGSRRSGGYGQVGVGRGVMAAHRAAFLLVHGWLPEVVMHTCDVPCCVNPEHLRAGTFAENTRDMFEKGRGFDLAAHMRQSRERIVTEDLV